MRDIIAYFIMGILAIVMISITPYQTLEMKARFGLTPRTFPYLVLWSIVGLSIIGLVITIYKRGVSKKEKIVMQNKKRMKMIRRIR